MKKALIIVAILIGIQLYGHDEFSLFKLYQPTLWETSTSAPLINLSFGTQNPKFVNFSYNITMPMTSYNLSFLSFKHNYTSRFITNNAQMSSRFQNLDNLDFNYIANKNKFYSLSSPSLKMKTF